jgi:hypothetical protein
MKWLICRLFHRKYWELQGYSWRGLEYQCNKCGKEQLK